MSGRIKGLLSELSARLRATYGNRLAGLYIYGAYARTEEDEESDLDVLVVLDRVDRYGAEIERTSHAVADISLKYNVSVSRAFVSEADWSRARTPFLANAREDAVPV
jgi:predicted nucleotidyltransferase